MFPCSLNFLLMVPTERKTQISDCWLQLKYKWVGWWWEFLKWVEPACVQVRSNKLRLTKDHKIYKCFKKQKNPDERSLWKLCPTVAVYTFHLPSSHFMCWFWWRDLIFHHASQLLCNHKSSSRTHLHLLMTVPAPMFSFSRGKVDSIGLNPWAEFGVL